MRHQPHHLGAIGGIVGSAGVDARLFLVPGAVLLHHPNLARQVRPFDIEPARRDLQRDRITELFHLGRLAKSLLTGSRRLQVDHGAAADIGEQVDLADDQPRVPHQSQRIGRGPDHRIDLLGRDFGSPVPGIRRRELRKRHPARQCPAQRGRCEQNDFGYRFHNHVLQRTRGGIGHRLNAPESHSSTRDTAPRQIRTRARSASLICINVRLRRGRIARHGGHVRRGRSGCCDRVRFARPRPRTVETFRPRRNGFEYAVAMDQRDGAAALQGLAIDHRWRHNRPALPAR